jgi:hypothetical protein
MAPMMEAAQTSEMLVNLYRSTQRYNPEDSHLHSQIPFFLVVFYLVKPFTTLFADISRFVGKKY